MDSGQVYRPLRIRSLRRLSKPTACATVGGNLCLAYAEGHDGSGVRARSGRHTNFVPPPRRRAKCPTHEFQTGVRQTILRPGEYLRKIVIRQARIRARAVLKRTSFTDARATRPPWLIATFDRANGETALTLSAARPRVSACVFDTAPGESEPRTRSMRVCAKHPLIRRHRTVSKEEPAGSSCIGSRARRSTKS